MKFNWGLFLVALTISVVGIIAIYSAVYGTELENLYLRQSAFLLIAIGVMFIFWRIPIRIHDGLAYIYYIIIIAILGITLLQSGEVKRWLGFGIFRIQPSEFSKLAMVLIIGRWIRDNLKNVDSVKTIAVSLLLIVPPFFLVVAEPDLGTGIVFCVLLFVMLYAGGVRPLHLFLLLTPFLAMLSAVHWIVWVIYMIILVSVLIKWRIAPVKFIIVLTMAIFIGTSTPYVWSKLHPYQRERIMVFLNPHHDPFGAGYQLIQSKIAIGSGGVLGKGLLQGTQTKLAFLPAKHSDFVFSVMGEQFGFVGVAILLFMFWVLLKKILDISSSARTPFASVVAMGIAGIIFFQVFINIAMTIGLAPITGIPLPFVSAGGSSLITFWAMIGILQNIHSQAIEPQ
ncbi:rod shape-determining protein RodA [bacterium]|nr:MAG: rod shape-determining protein RodA [bacterium]